MTKSKEVGRERFAAAVFIAMLVAAGSFAFIASQPAGEMCSDDALGAGTPLDISMVSSYASGARTNGIVLNSVDPSLTAGDISLDTITGFAAGEFIEEIRAGAFAGCTGLTSIELNAELDIIGPGAFDGCTGLASITVAAGNASFTSVDGVLFELSSGVPAVLRAYPAAKGVAEYTIPDTVTTIAAGSFDMPAALKLVLPESVVTVETGAFAGNAGNITIWLEPKGTPTDAPGTYSILFEPNAFGYGMTVQLNWDRAADLRGWTDDPAAADVQNLALISYIDTVPGLTLYPVWSLRYVVTYLNNLDGASYDYRPLVNNRSNFHAAEGYNRSFVNNADPTLTIVGWNVMVGGALLTDSSGPVLLSYDQLYDTGGTALTLAAVWGDAPVTPPAGQDKLFADSMILLLLLILAILFVFLIASKRKRKYEGEE